MLQSRKKCCIVVLSMELSHCARTVLVVTDKSILFLFHQGPTQLSGGWLFMGSLLKQCKPPGMLARFENCLNIKGSGHYW